MATEAIPVGGKLRVNASPSEPVRLTAVDADLHIRGGGHGSRPLRVGSSTKIRAPHEVTEASQTKATKVGVDPVTKKKSAKGDEDQ